ncbi:MAG: sulfite exporter TauE/SafE family protein [Pseudomonadota bacterium]
MQTYGLGYSLAGLVVGIAVGATGVGGGSLMTPILILFYGISPKFAVGTDLLYASISKSWGVVLHQRNGSMAWSIVGWLVLGSVPGAIAMLLFIQSHGSSADLDRLIKLTLAIAVMTTATFTLLQEPILRLVKRSENASGVGVLERNQKLGTVLSGLLIGAVVTISSVGAGVIGMMLLMMLYPKEQPLRLVGADLAHAVLITGLAGLGHAKLGTVDYALLGWLLLGAIPGIWIGSRLGFRMDAKALKRAISVMLIIAGSMTLYKAISG